MLAKTWIRSKEADELLEKIKSMPEILGKQEKVFLSQYGFSYKEYIETSKDEVLDTLKGLGKNLYISEKIKLIKDEN